MEFRLNKIDTELRQQVKDTTKSGVVHRKDEIRINHDKSEDTPKDRSFAYRLKKFKKGEGKIEVEAYKSQDIDVDAYKEEVEYCNEDRGMFIDIRK